MASLARVAHLACSGAAAATTASAVPALLTPTLLAPSSILSAQQQQQCRGLYDGHEKVPTVPPADEEAIERTPDAPPLEEQLPMGADAKDLGSVSTDAGEGFLMGAKKAAGEGARSDGDVVTGEAADRARALGAEEPEGGKTAAGEAVRKVKHAAWVLYNKAADNVMGSLDDDTRTRK